MSPSSDTNKKPNGNNLINVDSPTRCTRNKIGSNRFPSPNEGSVVTIARTLNELIVQNATSYLFLQPATAALCPRPETFFNNKTILIAGIKPAQNNKQSTLYPKPQNTPTALIQKLKNTLIALIRYVWPRHSL